MTVNYIVLGRTLRNRGTAPAESATARTALREAFAAHAGQLAVEAHFAGEQAYEQCESLAASFLAGTAPRGADDLAEELGVPDRTIDEVVGALRTGDLLAVAELDGEEDALVLTRDPHRVRVQDVYDALDGVTGPSDLRAESPLDAALEDAVREYDDARRATPTNRTLAELAATTAAAASPPEKRPAPQPGGDGTR